MYIKLMVFENHFSNCNAATLQRNNNYRCYKFTTN